MKKQNPNKLAFSKAAIVELNETQLKDVNGGTSPLSTAITTVYLLIELEK